MKIKDIIVRKKERPKYYIADVLFEMPDEWETVLVCVDEKGQEIQKIYDGIFDKYIVGEEI